MVPMDTGSWLIRPGTCPRSTGGSPRSEDLTGQLDRPQQALVLGEHLAFDQGRERLECGAYGIGLVGIDGGRDLVGSQEVCGVRERPFSTSSMI